MEMEHEKNAFIALSMIAVLIMIGFFVSMMCIVSTCSGPQEIVFEKIGGCNG